VPDVLLQTVMACLPTFAQGYTDDVTFNVGTIVAPAPPKNVDTVIYVQQESMAPQGKEHDITV